MAKKIPPPLVRHDPDQTGQRNDQRPDQSGDQYGSHRNYEAEDHEGDTVSPLPPPSPRTGNFGGAIPRRTYQRSPPSPSPNEAQQHQRRFDPHNLDPPGQVPTRSLFDFSDLIPNLCSNFSGSGSAEVTALEGQELYLHFVHEQLRQLRSAQLGDDYVAREEARLSEYHSSEAHFHDGQEVDGAGSLRRRRRTQSMNLENFQNPIWRETGRELQSLADTFANSTERILVRERAAQVDVSTIDKDTFIALLKELFQGGRVTRERILVLFFFCSDIAILAVQSRISGLLAELTRWSLNFIRDQVCSWVHQNGGWSVVLRSGLNLIQQAAVIGMCTAVITCCFIYIRKNMS